MAMNANSKTARSYCTPSNVEVVSCKIPLLDGDAKEAKESIVTEVEINQKHRLCEVARVMNGSLEGIICIAWALLLRCYTGQDQVCFELIGDVIEECPAQHEEPGTYTSVFRKGFQREDILSTCVRQASSSHTCPTQSLQMKFPPGSNTQGVSQSWNTTLSIQSCGPQHSNQSDGLVALQPLNATQVSDPAPFPSTLTMKRSDGSCRVICDLMRSCSITTLSSDWWHSRAMCP